MSLSVPTFYDDLAETLAESWRLLARGVADRRSAFHHPVVATLGLDGRPCARTVILRSCDAGVRLLRFHTDIRSEKIAELRRDPRVAMHFYDSGAKIQVRVEGRAALHADDGIADAAWGGSRLFSRQCYGVVPGPGTEIGQGGDFTLPDTSNEETVAGRANFVAVIVAVEQLEWLYLAAAGHRRALFSWNSDVLQSGWRTP
ncbi:MAG: pyridoxamine 5'-phosphate oxidase family protein [Beijerinckiaceae bacterium]